MAASSEDMQKLHSIVVKSLIKRIDEDMEDNLPTDAATLGAAIKLLKDNDITSDPADKEDLNTLRDTFAKLSAERKSRASNVVDIVKGDLKAAG